MIIPLPRGMIISGIFRDLLFLKLNFHTINEQHRLFNKRNLPKMTALGTALFAKQVAQQTSEQ